MNRLIMQSKQNLIVRFFTVSMQTMPLSGDQLMSLSSQSPENLAESDVIRTTSNLPAEVSTNVEIPTETPLNNCGLNREDETNNIKYNWYIEFTVKPMHANTILY